MVVILNKKFSEFSEKYTKTGYLGVKLIKGFYSAIEAMVCNQHLSVKNALEIGAGQGYSTELLDKMLPDGCVFSASELESDQVKIAQKRLPHILFKSESVYQLKHKNKSIELVFLLEVLEHLEEPQKALKELHRVCGKYLILSTPREPLWRMANMARGSYWGSLGNTPGHIQHWSTKGLIAEVSTYFDLIEVKKPFPWSILLLKPK